MLRRFAVLRGMNATTVASQQQARPAYAEPRVEVVDLAKPELGDVVRDPEVTALAPVMPTALVRPVPDPVLPARLLREDEVVDGTAWGVAAVGAHSSGRTGEGVVVSVLDTGIDASHPAFSGVRLTEADFTGSGNGDRQGHGTHCAGTIFGRSVDGTRIGVAPGVPSALIGKVLGDDGSGDSEMLFRGISWAVENGAQVISMSLGFDFPGLVARLTDDGWPVDLATSAALEAYRANLRMFDALMDVVRNRAAFGPGALVVAAAGNESRREVDPGYEIAVSLPAAAESVLSTGALARGDAGLVVAPFSNTLPAISAPGVGVVSARAGGGLVALNGTSMAAPHVAGVSALWWQEVSESALPHSATTVSSRLLANADIGSFAPGVDVADRGVGLVRAP